jgi:hypothetical protein
MSKSSVFGHRRPRHRNSLLFQQMTESFKPPLTAGIVRTSLLRRAPKVVSDIYRRFFPLYSRLDGPFRPYILLYCTLTLLLDELKSVKTCDKSLTRCFALRATAAIWIYYTPLQQQSQQQSLPYFCDSAAFCCWCIRRLTTSDAKTPRLI